MLKITLKDGTEIDAFMVGLTIYFFEDKKLSDLENIFTEDNISNVVIKEGENTVGVYENLKIRSITKDYINKQVQIELSK